MVKVDLPPPDTPVTQVNRPPGISPVTVFRLLPVAPLIFSIFLRSTGRRPSGGSSISRSPVRYLAVSELGLAMTSAGVPWAQTSPPWMPAAGPMSMT